MRGSGRSVRTNMLRESKTFMELLRGKRFTRWDYGGEACGTHMVEPFVPGVHAHLMVINPYLQ